MLQVCERCHTDAVTQFNCSTVSPLFVTDSSEVKCWQSSVQSSALLLYHLYLKVCNTKHYSKFIFNCPQSSSVRVK